MPAKSFFLIVFSVSFSLCISQSLLLVPDRIFDGMEMHEGWQVLINGKTIEAVGLNVKAAPGTKIIVLKGQTLMPGIIEGHAHILLHPYNETPWNDQVLFESQAERVVRAYTHMQASLMAGITTIRDLGTEGAAYADVGIKAAITKGVMTAPDLLCAGKAIVATGAYGPRSQAFEPPLGAEVADGSDVIKVVRDQIGHGVDLIKIYADYGWGNTGAAQPTFSIEEIKVMVETAASAGMMVVAHATTKEGMRRAVLGGVKTIEHGDDGDREIFDLMKKNNVAFCPTLAAGEAVSSYRGWNKLTDPLPERIQKKHQSFKAALESGVTILMGGDVGVFTHGDNVREMILMHEYGMPNLDIMKSSTSLNANVFGLHDRGEIAQRKLADIIAVEGNPSLDMSLMKRVKFVMKNGVVVKE